jgi:hypothetical protein
LRRVVFLALLCVPCAASIPAHCEEPVVSIGKQRAASSAIHWDVHDVNHPLLGPIKFALPRRAVATAVQGDKIVSLAYVSCQKGTGKVALELTNAFASDPAGGLGPADLPRLVCSSPGPQGHGDMGLVKSDLAASWEINALGDTLARGLSPSALRRCVSIDVLQNVALPPGRPHESQRIAMEITPYNRELDSVFTECGETSAFAPMEQPAPATPPMGRLEPARGNDRGARSADVAWKPARTIAKGRTNVRSAASLDSSVVVQLAPGARILVQRTSTEWWKVKPRSGAGFSGYIRQDRVAFE